MLFQNVTCFKTGPATQKRNKYEIYNGKYLFVHLLSVGKPFSWTISP